MTVNTAKSYNSYADVSPDVFISYRRSDAEAHAHMLYADLSRRGYSVFYDHETLGAGDFHENIRVTIEACTDVVVLLSPDSLGPRIEDANDIFRYEVACALRMKKRIVGIFIGDFNSFPDKLPDDIAELSRVNCLTARMEYYDAMLDKLTNGQFLLSSPHLGCLAQEQIPDSSKADALEHFRRLPVSEKLAYMTMVIDLAEKFNRSEECMRFYKYVDACDRLRGVRDLPAYDGEIPLDLATYLNFFENLYLLIATETLSLALVDDTYRFRFFAGCNNKLMQESELLPLGYQYPNIVALYELWREMIRSQNESETPRKRISEEIYLYERDFHCMLRCYRIANDLSSPQHFNLIDRRFRKLSLEARRLDLASIDESMAFQDEVIQGIPGNAERSIFEKLTHSEMTHSLETDVCIGFYDDVTLVGQLNVILRPEKHQDLLHDVRDLVPGRISSSGVVDSIIVAERCRGFGMQRCMLNIAKYLARRFGLDALLAVVSPNNPVSARNFMLEGFHMVATRPKYHSERDYYLYETSQNGGGQQVLC